MSVRTGIFALNQFADGTNKTSALVYGEKTSLNKATLKAITALNKMEDAVLQTAASISPVRINSNSAPAAGGQSNAELVAEVKALKELVARLITSNEATANNTGKIAENTGNTTRILQGVTNGGNAVQTKAVA